MTLEKFSKKQMTTLMRQDLKLTADKADEVFDYVVYQMREALVEGKAVEFRSLGTFQVVQRPERKGRNPQTGAEILIPAKNKVRFRESAALSVQLNEVAE